MDRQNNFDEFEKLFWQLSRKMEHQWKDIYVQTFPGSQSHIMYLLEQSGPKKMSELADSLHVTAGAVTTASNQLIEQGYISRIRDEKDRRVVHLELTEKGRETLNELQNKGRKIMKLVFNDISDTDLRMMNAIFKQATINIDNM
ncbi:MarR family winged helix-turn-helix transcriptional regulator [Oceanobacillus sp. Castelsardo]|uniref:MarR family winged helix-turn-helix transcriptional regulator n=1 Tax=Oceanobacillus sp. Castelsardo TaxID=1851204 RepID=UPI0008384703|nr:MarR family transcriptional regulator [Oceanobacillus sp. Castelsardo]